MRRTFHGADSRNCTVDSTTSHLSDHNPVASVRRISTGIYIDTFITPNELRSQSFKKNLVKVQQASQYAIRAGARVAALGGFTSIVLEGSKAILSQNAPTVFTTGNTLTFAYIVKGVGEAIRLRGRKLNDCGLLIIGSTGDIGSGCTYYLADKVKALFLMCTEFGSAPSATAKTLQPSSREPCRYISSRIPSCS